MNKIELITPPVVSPITVTEAKEHIKLDSDVTVDDVLIQALINAAVNYGQLRNGRQYITATYDYFLDRFPAQEIELPLSPIQSITSIKYIDEDGATQTWSSAEYESDLKNPVARIRPVSTATYPATKDVYNAVTVRFVAGFGDAGSDCPDAQISALKLLFAHFYENREALNKFASKNFMDIPIPAAVNLLFNLENVRGVK